ADVPDQNAGHVGELAEAQRVPLEQRADDVLDVPAGAEGAARSGEHDRARRFLRVQRVEGVAKLLVDLEGERVQPVGTVQRDRGDAGRGVQLVEEGARRDGHPSTAVASISTTAPRSTSPLTATSDTAG